MQESHIQNSLDLVGAKIQGLGPKSFAARSERPPTAINRWSTAKYDDGRCRSVPRECSRPAPYPPTDNRSASTSGSPLPGSFAAPPRCCTPSRNTSPSPCPCRKAVRGPRIAIPRFSSDALLLWVGAEGYTGCSTDCRDA